MNVFGEWVVAFCRWTDSLVPANLKSACIGVSRIVRDSTGYWFGPATWICLAALAYLTVAYVRERQKRA